MAPLDGRPVARAEASIAWVGRRVRRGERMPTGETEPTGAGADGAGAGCDGATYTEPGGA